MPTVKAGRLRDNLYMLPGPGRRDVLIPDKFKRSSKERSVRVKSVLSDGKTMTGTGVIIETGVVVSNWHLVDDPKIISSTVNDHPAQIIHFDLLYDLVALSGTTRRLGRVKFQDKPPHQTQEVYYVGNPEDWNKAIPIGNVVKVTKTRIISDNSPCEGMSGSGLYSKETGELVGIIDSMEGGSAGYNFTVAVPIPILKNFLAEVFDRVRFNSRSSPRKPTVEKKEKTPRPPHKFNFDE